MKLKSLLLPAFVFFALNASAQHERCGNNAHEEILLQQDQGRAAARQAYEQNLQQWIDANRNSPSVQSVITVPVVVHIVLQQNLPVNQVYSQIDVLNQDFARTNADAANTPAAFQSVAANTTIQFCMAHQDPNGNWTDGIEYRQCASNFDCNYVKSYANGGLNAWDPTRYFNIWVCDMSFILGYAEFPTASVSNSYGVVIGKTYFGSNHTSYGSGFNLDPYYDRGRTATHEIGHCFNLYHIWGDDGGACSGTDYCADTPNQASETYGTPTFPLTDACSPNDPGIMFMNYMDYTDDVAMNIFTNDQKARMLAVLGTAPYNALASSNACSPNGMSAVASGFFNVSLYPNPASDQFNIRIETDKTVPVSFEFFDAPGRLVYRVNAEADPSGLYPIDVQGLANGIYTVAVQSGERRTVLRLIVNR